jgi:xanthine dehydrogenase YagS FAD-binding subunit
VYWALSWKKEVESDHMLHEIPPLEHVEPKTLKEAVYWLDTYGEKARVIAGGTDLLGLIKDEVSGPKLPFPEVLVDISKISEMKNIEFNGKEGLTIGAGVTLSELEESPEVRKRFGILGQAAKSIGTPQIRSMGTVGGNICQRPWCWYFRHPSFPCYKKGGKQCYAIAGEHKYYFSILGLGVCVMSHPSDLAPALVASDATMLVAGPVGKKIIPIRAFFNGPGEVFENVLKTNEILVGVRVPRHFEEFNGVYLKDRIRDTWDFALTSAAVLLKMSGDECIDARVCLGGVAPHPYRAEPAEQMLKNKRVDEETAAMAAKVSLERAKPLPMTKYKVELSQTILKRAILRASRANA